MMKVIALALASIFLAAFGGGRREADASPTEGGQDKIPLAPWSKKSVRLETLYLWSVPQGIDAARLELHVGRAGGVKKKALLRGGSGSVQFKLLEKPGKRENRTVGNPPKLVVLEPYTCFTDIDLTINMQYEWEFRVGSEVIQTWTAYLYGRVVMTRTEPQVRNLKQDGFSNMEIPVKMGDKVTLTIDGLNDDEGKAVRLRFGPDSVPCKYTRTGTEGNRSGTLTFTIPKELGKEKKLVTSGSKYLLDLRISRPQTDWKDCEPIDWGFEGTNGLSVRVL